MTAVIIHSLTKVKSKTMKKNWQVYKMNNEGQKVIVSSGLSYETAVSLSQYWNTRGSLFHAYEAI